ncbi:MAG TPA: FtsX-like permease family protein [Planctomycetes bacterium]|nr:FtsX-like permease family protein [Planctomycetota bacterium]
MSLTTRIVRRSLVAHPGRTLFSILGVALGIATVVAVFTLDHVTVLSRTRDLTADFGADLEVRPSTDDGDPRADLMKLEGVAGVAAFFQNDVGIRPVQARSGEDDRPRAVRLVGLEAGSARTLGVYHVGIGRDLDRESAADGVLLGAKLAEELGVGVGDRVVLTQPERAVTKTCIDGVLREDAPEEARPPRERVFRVVGLLDRDGLGRRAGGRIVVTDFDAGRELLRDVLVVPEFWLKRSRDADLETLESGLSKSFTFQRNATRAVGQMADERAFRNGVRLAGLFALLLGLFVIFHTLSMSLVERVREVGILHALGATRVEIGRIFFTEALVISGCAGALGFAGGAGLAAAMLTRGISTLGVTGHPVGPFELPWRAAISLTALGVGVALVGSIWPMLRAKNSDVVAILRGDRSDLGGGGRGARGLPILSALLLFVVVPVAFFWVVPVIGAAETTLVLTLGGGLLTLALVLGFPLLAPGLLARITSRVASPFERVFPLVGRLAAKNLATSPTRVGASVAAIALVASAFVGLEGMTASLVGESEEWAREAAGNKVWVEGLPDVPFDEVARTLHAIPGVLGVESRQPHAFPSFFLLGLRIDEIGGVGPLAADPELARRMREEQGIVISTRLARQRGLAVGDRVLLKTSGAGVQEFPVVAVSDAYGYFLHPFDERAFGVISEANLVRYFCVSTDKTRSIAVHTDGTVGKDEISAALVGRFGWTKDMYRYDEASLVRLLTEDLRVDFVLFDIILALTAILAGIGVLNGQLLSALERRKELGILRALGTTRGQIAGTVLVESIVIGGVGGGLGLVVGSGLTPVLVSALRVLSGLPLPVRSAGPLLAAIWGGAVLLAVLAALVPIWRMSRFEAVRDIRTG